MQKPFLSFIFLLGTLMYAQDQKDLDYYAQIPDYPENYTPGTVVSRMIDGLGFRYYWATAELRPEDLAYKPSETNRTIEETIDHIYGLSRVIYNSAIKEVNQRSNPKADTLDFAQKRAKTLANFQKAAKIFLTAEDLTEHRVQFQNAEGVSDYPFWNQINGPLEDAVWHCGQIVALRRASGNPFPAGVSVFRGVKRDN
ncbi:DinB family protein [Poritiphilus flavus]|uniref:DinB family protein n=1 Tax=Poritiphilus flavus TaxID=2697053 RepID=A0A6L9EC61_9FLAO|nr:hypothetical protein [Poritiphilus flavus]NAS11999.1 hypothetical protein [Poritiphilus flavus]